MSDAKAGGRHLLTLAEASESPCATCPTSPCCTHLPLHSFRVDDLRALDHARYLLNFERIELGIAPSGEWSAYYHHPCRFLDRETSACTIHETDLQPQICRHYQPHGCWYKAALSGDLSSGFLRIDRARFEHLAQAVRFDDQRRIVETPSWELMLAQLAEIPLHTELSPEPTADPVFERWLEESLTGPIDPAPPAPASYDSLVGACSGCSAACCTTLVFPHGVPATRSSLDYLQFALGFPGIEVGVTDAGWRVVVKTRCRHLDTDALCSVFGQPERPLVCQYYDASACDYVVQFGRTRPPGFVRLQLEQFYWMTEMLSFDAGGELLGLPAAEDVREYVEARWREIVAEVARRERDDDAQAPSMFAPAGVSPAEPSKAGPEEPAEEQPSP